MTARGLGMSVGGAVAELLPVHEVVAGAGALGAAGVVAVRFTLDRAVRSPGGGSGSPGAASPDSYPALS